MKFNKKIFILLFTCLILCPKSFAVSENIALLTEKGFFNKVDYSQSGNPYEDVRKTLCAHLKYSNTYNLEGLKSIYAPNYVSADGLNKTLSFELIQKTWQSYPDIKYKMEITSISVNGNSAVVHTKETATATTSTKSGVISKKGALESNSGAIYYLEKTNNQWLIISDYISFEKTYLTYGTAQLAKIDLNSPSQIAADTPYTATLTIIPPKDTLVIASIGKENITYPQTVADEVFRKLNDKGLLERMFKSNNQNINEYTVASFGLTKAELKGGTEIKIYITGLGFAMSRVNVIPTNNYIKKEEGEKSAKTK